MMSPHTLQLINVARRPGVRGDSRVRRSGFTLIEILIVVVILGILAAIVVPELSSASRQARENVLKDDLRFMREQITRYMIQHDDDPPGYPPGGDTTATPDEASFIDQMTRYTDIQSNPNGSYTNTYRYGPYLTKIPQNPLTSKSGILVVANGSPIPAPDLNQPYGWIYKPQTLQFLPNLPGTDLDGKAYMSY
jgi:prepilin-type N-terminal cleavage/methylation domain-containing protein